MLIQQKCFVLGVNQKTSKKGDNYLMVNLADSQGVSFSIMSKDIELLKLNQFQAYDMELELSNTKYGLQLTIKSVTN
ncbi:hypothetical protein [Clostridium perfringens]|uniref:hypothetical protein n=1 Tax=Clostridium perfringens TaxID=1502 RepID=UPI0018E45A8C|nr:hypothetical protein [Clostridium perfringens]MBI6042189.1 hypothetical protein [Clostridium perfringens]